MSPIFSPFFLSFVHERPREAREEEREETLQEGLFPVVPFYLKVRHSTNALARQSNEQPFFYSSRVYAFLFLLLTHLRSFFLSFSRSLFHFHFLSFLLCLACTHPSIHSRATHAHAHIHALSCLQFFIRFFALINDTRVIFHAHTVTNYPEKFNYTRVRSHLVILCQII